jgi:methyl-accepting chemotaxis protein
MVFILSLVGSLLSIDVRFLGISNATNKSKFEDIMFNIDQLMMPSSIEEANITTGISSDLSKIAETSVLLPKVTASTQLFLWLSLLAISLTLLTLSQNQDTIGSTRLSKDHTADESYSDFEDIFKRTENALASISNELQLATTLPSKHAPKEFYEKLIDKLIEINAHMKSQSVKIKEIHSANTRVLKEVEDLDAGVAQLIDESQKDKIEWHMANKDFRYLQDKHAAMMTVARKIENEISRAQAAVAATSKQEKQLVEQERISREEMEQLSSEFSTSADLINEIGTITDDSSDLLSRADKLILGLEKRASEIIKITDTIDDITEQTNQLALNASIEAARAGEQGKGFAVVADEVSNLAARSSNATKNINELLGSIQSEINETSNFIQKGLTSVNQSKTSTQKISEIFKTSNKGLRHSISSIQQIRKSLDEFRFQITGVLSHHSECVKLGSYLNSYITDINHLDQSILTQIGPMAARKDTLAQKFDRHRNALRFCLDHIRLNTQKSETLTETNIKKQDDVESLMSNLTLFFQLSNDHHDDITMHSYNINDKMLDIEYELNKMRENIKPQIFGKTSSIADGNRDYNREPVVQEIKQQKKVG